MTAVLLLTLIALTGLFAWAEELRIERDRLQLTCEACRWGAHADCVSTIVIAGGRLDGVHQCACVAPGHPVSNPTSRKATP